MRNFLTNNVVVCLMSLVMLVYTATKVKADVDFEEIYDLTLLENMQITAAQASESCVPMVIMLSQFSCGHCEKLREKVLLPLMKSGELDNKVMFRELPVDSDELVTDINGNTATGMELAKRYIKNVLTPTMLIIEPSSNKVIERIVGISNIDFYSLYLEEEINSAYSNMSSMCLKDTKNT